MRGIGGWTVVGLASLVAVIATPASAQGSAAPVEVVDAAKARAVRWVLAARVRLRGAPAADAPVLGGLSASSPLTLHGTVGDWCDVTTGDGTRGFVACRYLGEDPVDLATIGRPLRGGEPNPDYDPARAFEFEPSWWTLETYAAELDRRRREHGLERPATPDPVLDAMKAELAKGAFGAPPLARADFVALQRRVAAVAADTADAAERETVARDARDQLQLWAEPYQQDIERVLAVAASIPLPPVRPSWFGGDDVIAAPDDDAEALSGRFGIVHRMVTTKASAPTPDEWNASLYDIGGRVHSLARPLHRAVLFRDGRVQARASHARQRLAAMSDDHGCSDWHAGFMWGDLSADDPAWAPLDAYESDGRRARDGTGVPVDSLYAFYTDAPLPETGATVVATASPLDVAATGFVRATSHTFDLDGDAVPDLLVWEATGPGPGHFEATGTDDTWYRLVLVNAGGRWKVLGTDQFSYGCGC